MTEQDLPLLSLCLAGIMAAGLILVFLVEGPPPKV